MITETIVNDLNACFFEIPKTKKREKLFIKETKEINKDVIIDISLAYDHDRNNHNYFII